MPHSKTPECDWLYEVEDDPARGPVQLKEALTQIVKRFSAELAKVDAKIEQIQTGMEVAKATGIPLDTFRAITKAAKDNE